MNISTHVNWVLIRYFCEVNKLDLNDRKLKILNAIVEDYILTAEPIGSRTIEKKYSLGISAATIRNEMSDLEDLGLIIAPHASAGRIPSDKGYRLYVDNICKTNLDDGFNTFKSLINDNIGHIENLMEETARAVSEFTNYATLVSEESFLVYKIKRLQLIPINEKSVLLVMIFDKDIIKNKNLTVVNEYTEQYLEKLTLGLNKFLSGVIIEDINEDIILEILSFVEGEGYDESLVRSVIDEILSSTQSRKDTKFYKSGVNNILEYPELYNNSSKVKEIFESIEKQDFVSSLLLNDSKLEEDTDKFEIIIGEENDYEQMRDLTVLKAKYKISEGRYGSIGIIGPKRMNYEQTISVLNGIVKNISAVIEENENKE